MMSKFFLMPAKADLGRRFAAFLAGWFPGVHPDTVELAEQLAVTAEATPGVYVLFADELPDERGAALEPLLIDAFGAELADRVIDLRSGPLAADGVLDTWIIRGASSRSKLRKVS